MRGFEKVSPKRKRILRWVITVAVFGVVLLGYGIYAWFIGRRDSLPPKVVEAVVTNTVFMTNTETVRVVETNRVAITNVKTNYKRVYVIEPAKDIQEVISNEERK